MFSTRLPSAVPVWSALYLFLGLTPLPAAEPVKDAKQISNSLGMKLIRIPAGKFIMGSPKEEKDRRDGEDQHEVEITKPSYMGMYTVTQAEYERVMGNNPSFFCASDKRKNAVAGKDTSRFPVENISWNPAAEFCRKLSELPEEKQAGRKYRLPTEAEWEYACRAGTTTVFHFGNSLSSEQANFRGEKPYGDAPMGKHLGRTAAVGSYPPNAFGLYEMHGNVCQWCQDYFDANCYKNSPRQDPKGPEKGSNRVYRGGSNRDRGQDCRAAARYDSVPDWNGGRRSYGIRVVVADEK